MAVYAGRFVVFLACVLFCISNVSESKERSKNGCVVCGKKSQGSPFRHVDKNEELEVCFGVRASGDICEASRRALQDHRNRGKTYHHVSVFLMQLIRLFIFKFSRRYEVLF